jgi:hypothetical protein
VTPSVLSGGVQRRHMRAGKAVDMSIHTAILTTAILDLGVVLAVAATMLVPFMLDRRRPDATVYAFATPLPEDLAA